MGGGLVWAGGGGEDEDRQGKAWRWVRVGVLSQRRAGGSSAGVSVRGWWLSPVRNLPPRVRVWLGTRGITETGQAWAEGSRSSEG